MAKHNAISFDNLPLRERVKWLIRYRIASWALWVSVKVWRQYRPDEVIVIPADGYTNLLEFAYREMSRPEMTELRRALQLADY